MKITELKLLHIEPRWLVLRVETDSGIVGYGEPIVEGKARTVEAAVRELEPILVGADPRRIEHIWQQAYRGGFYREGPVLMSAISGVDQALWDIKGKALGVPVYELLGGRVRDKVLCYAHVAQVAQTRPKSGSAYPDARKDQELIALAAGAKQRVDEGFTAVKTGAPAPLGMVESPQRIAEIARRFAAIREAVGEDVGIGIDFHGRVSPPLVKLLVKALEPYNPMFYEEPVLSQHLDVMADVAASTHIPIATGERIFSRWGFRELFERRAATIVQPDLCHAGGISEVRRIAAAAETHGVGIAPHNPLGPISFAAGVQLAACTPNFVMQEFVGRPDGRDRGEGILTEPIRIEDGYVTLTEKPGLGIDVDWDRLVKDAAASDYTGDWPTPQLRHEDGSVAEW